MVIPGTDITSSKRAIEIAQQFENVYAAVGIHPHHVYELMKSSQLLFRSELVSPKGGPGDSCSTSKIEESLQIPLTQTPTSHNNFADSLKLIGQMLLDPKVVAVGEIGIDKHEYQKTKYESYVITPELLAMQKQLVEKQISLGLRNNKSIILHNREARGDLLEILRKVDMKYMEYRTVFHCCEPDLQLLQFAKQHKFFIGVDGDVTYGKEKQGFIKEVPLDMLVLETDAPFLLPEPLRSEKKYPNNPGNIPLIAKFIADLKGESVEMISRETTQNARRLFNLPENK